MDCQAKRPGGPQAWHRRAALPEQRGIQARAQPKALPQARFSVQRLSMQPCSIASLRSIDAYLVQREGEARQHDDVDQDKHQGERLAAQALDDVVRQVLHTTIHQKATGVR